jgi:hypothetical protein
MAKKKEKISSKADCCVGGAVTYSPTTHLEFDDVKELKGLSVGDKITVVLRGTVKSLEQREDYSDPKKVCASLSLTDFEAEIVPNSTEFDDLCDDEDC